MVKLILLWLITLASCFAFVKLVPWGPVIFTVSKSHGWGVHLGDLIIFIPLIALLIYSYKQLSL